MKRKRILIAPLDWGLGHASRCIPIITQLLTKGFEVIIAADNRPAELLKKEFPLLEHVVYPGYSISYPAETNMAWSIFRQLPALMKGISDEHKLLQSIVTRYGIDAVICIVSSRRRSSSVMHLYNR